MKSLGAGWEDIKQVAEVVPCIIVCGEGRNDSQGVTCTEYSTLGTLPYSRVMLGTLWRSDKDVWQPMRGISQGA